MFSARIKESKIERPNSTPHEKHTLENSVGAKTSSSLESIAKPKKHYNPRPLNPITRLALDNLLEKKKITPIETKKTLEDVEEINALTRTHIIEESKEVLSWIPTEANEPNVILHYKNNKSPLFETMQLVRGQINSKFFNVSDWGYKTNKFLHLSGSPNSIDKKSNFTENKQSHSFLKGATVIIPICYGVQHPMDGGSIAKLAKNYIVHHGAGEVIVYLGRYSDPEFKIPAANLEEVGKQKREAWLEKNKAALTPSNVHIKNESLDLKDSTVKKETAQVFSYKHDYLHKVKIVSRTDWVRDTKFKKAEGIFKFFLDTKLDNNHLLETIEKDVSIYRKRMQEKDLAKNSPLSTAKNSPVLNAKTSPSLDSTAHKSSSTRLLQDTFSLSGSEGFLLEAPPLQLSAEALEKVCKLTDKEEILEYTDKIALANASYFFNLNKHLKQLAEDHQAQVTQEAERVDSTLSPTGETEATSEKENPKSPTKKLTKSHSSA